jgi:hypothetical protein
VRLGAHLLEDGLRDVVVAAPVGGALGVGELVHVVAVALARQALGLGVDLVAPLDEVAAPAVEGDLRHLGRRGAARHDGDEGQAQQAREVGLGHRRAARGRFDDRGAFADPAVAQRVQKQRACQPVLEAAGGVGGFVLEVDLHRPARAGRRETGACRPSAGSRARCGARPRWSRVCSCLGVSIRASSSA